MKDEYVSLFREVVKDTSFDTGIELPEPIEAYVVMLLASFVDRPNFLPTDSFAEQFLRLQSNTRTSAKDLGDICLFITGVFPLYGRRRGLNRKYYQDIGSSSYGLVAETMNAELFGILSKRFDFLSDFIEVTIHSTKGEHYNLFR